MEGHITHSQEHKFGPKCSGSQGAWGVQNTPWPQHWEFAIEGQERTLGDRGGDCGRHEAGALVWAVTEGRRLTYRASQCPAASFWCISFLPLGT